MLNTSISKHSQDKSTKLHVTPYGFLTKSYYNTNHKSIHQCYRIINNGFVIEILSDSIMVIGIDLKNNGFLRKELTISEQNLIKQLGLTIYYKNNNIKRHKIS